jgi:hypothetical protein
MTAQPSNDTLQLADRMKDTIRCVEGIDTAAARVLRTAVGRLGWRRALEAPAAEVVTMLRRYYGGRGIELAGIVFRVRRGDAPSAIATDTTSRWMKHWVWEREARACRLARLPFAIRRTTTSAHRGLS